MKARHAGHVSEQVVFEPVPCLGIVHQGSRDQATSRTAPAEASLDPRDAQRGVTSSQRA